ncbi:hypothetical protein LT85_0344 [Collimonas arenae]|uniref:Uncharacterized protein n=1 Tax=Collimonas arenae TaxID=279058 RepID=A0A0A1F737_9BURK|nr:hypothetical protein LT85_0344 [Collimonas arenae]
MLIFANGKSDANFSNRDCGRSLASEGFSDIFRKKSKK